MQRRLRKEAMTSHPTRCWPASPARAGRRLVADSTQFRVGHEPFGVWRLVATLDFNAVGAAMSAATRFIRPNEESFTSQHGLK
jgi:hypothetical protein